MDGLVWPGELELRREGESPVLRGMFPYNSLATLRDRGRVRKERFRPHAFRFAIEDTARPLDLLVGHDFGKPLASRGAGTLDIADSEAGVSFEARFPPEARQPTWMRDALLAVSHGLMAGLSPGFRVPPRSAVPDAEELTPEPGNPAVMIRDVRQAVLREMSVLTNPAYANSEVELRAELEAAAAPPRRVFTWL